MRHARLHADMSQFALAQSLGITRGAVANWESNGGALPATDRLQRIALTTNVSFEWLATGRGDCDMEPCPDEVPASEMQVVKDQLELRLLHAFRSMPPEKLTRLVAAVETRSSRFRKTPPPTAG
ncbi:MAG: helix-turn-helix domain-containing protein [Thermomonas sp.]|uniref:transcriptional regulator n=1 Tax=Thermomonas sp. TaxID=1971895 RepID=UPI0039E23E8B